MTYAEVLDYFYAQLPMFHRVGPAAYKPSLATTEALMQRIGSPEKRLRCVHIAGTNGKGSVSHLIASSLQEAGYKTGLCTSPHLVDFRERVRINGVMIPQDAVVDFVSTYRSAWDDLQPSFFEMSIALSFWYLDRESVDIAVVETGLGGRLDSTNVVLPEVAVITNIGFDHVHLLGDTIEKIAGEKAGIIKAGRPVIAGPMRPAALAVISERATALHAPLTIVGDGDPAPPTVLLGNYQEENRRTAYAALNALAHTGWDIPQDAIERGFRRVTHNTGLRGRWEVVSQLPRVIVDVGHNEDGIRTVVQQLEKENFDRLHVVLGMVNDKDIGAVLQLLPRDAVYYFCKANIPRGLDAQLLAEQARNAGLTGSVFPDVPSAYAAARAAAGNSDLIFVGGSFFTVAEVLE